MEITARQHHRRAQFPPGLATAALDSSATACFLTDSNGRILWVNQAFTGLSGFTFAEAVGQTPRILKSGLQDDAYYRRLWTAITAGVPFSSTVVNQTRSGGLYYVAQTVTPLPQGSHTPSHFLAFQEDISSQLAYERELQSLAYTDPLTGLANRRALMECLAAAEQTGASAALLLLDMDQFKTINDCFGHDQGDAALRCVAQAMELAEPDGGLYRLGGDEFVVLLGGSAATVEERALAAARRLTQEVASAADGRDGWKLSVSIGVAISSAGSPGSVGLLRAADLALSSAKASGTGVTLYKPAMGRASVREARLRRDLPAAIGGGEIRVVFQPISDLTSGRRVSVEALARWQHPQYGKVPPEEFIAIAEQNGTIGQLGDQVLRTAMRECAKTCRATGLRLAVNVSPVQLRDQLFPLRLSAAIRETGMDANLLDLEVTESTALDGAAVSATLARLRNSGVGLVVDDFGAGSSRLSYLADFPMTALKLDRSLLLAAASSPRHELFVRGIVASAHLLGIRIIGEGIETQPQLDMLRHLGCDEGQGYLLGRPSDVHPAALAS